VSGLIKSSSAAAALFRPVSFPAQEPKAQAPTEVEELRAEIARLLALLGARDSEIERLRGAAPRLLHDAEEKGRKAGHAAAESREADRLRLLEERSGKALDQLSAALGETERMAALVARAALDKLFGDGAARTAEVTAILRRQMAEIEAQSLIRVEVARADFGDDAARDALSRALDRPGLEVCVSEQLQAGDCRLKLVLGTIEAGLDRQWGALRTLLASFGDGSPAR
jgi:flagellar biosynthesis/type III secretory pathway protein FliH